MFSVNFDIIIELLLPVWLRQPVQLAWLKALATPLKVLYNGFITYRLATLRDVSHTGQVMYIEKLLNGVNQTAGMIWLNDNDVNRNDDYLYNQAEGQPVIYLYNVIENTPRDFRNEIEYFFMDDFIVNVPDITSIQQEAFIRNIINKYKPAGKRYSLKNYTENPA